MGVLGEMFPRKRIHDDADAAQGGQRWALGPIDLDKGVVTLQATGAPAAGDAPEGGDAESSAPESRAPESGAPNGADSNGADPDGPAAADRA